jgi:hypothetical protein
MSRLKIKMHKEEEEEKKSKKKGLKIRPSKGGNSKKNELNAGGLEGAGGGGKV